MTIPLVILAAGAAVAGFIGIPAALGGGDMLGHFLEPSFHPAVLAGVSAATAAHDLARGPEAAVMILSVLAASAGILLARRVYFTRPEVADRLARSWSGVHALLYNQFYVQELYDRTIVRGTLGAAALLRAVDRRVVDAAVDGAGLLTQTVAWCSHMIDKHLVDGIVNGIGKGAGRCSFFIRRLQTGLVQNYALLMVFGLFTFLTLYLLGG